MKRWSVLAVAASLLYAAFSQEFSITAIAQKSGLSWEEAAAALLLAKTFGVDMTMVISTRKEAATPVFALAPAVVIAKVSKKDLREILKAHSKGHGWGVIAHQLGVHPSAFNKQRVALNKLSDDDLEASVWLSVLSQVFGTPSEQIVVLRRQGLNWGDVIAALQVASATRQSPDKVLVIWQQSGKDWTKVRAKLGVSPDWLPSPQKSDEDAKEAKGKGHEKGQGKGQGKGKH
ncbi:MAG: hypothetical protein KEFWMYNX_000122 [Candidatus Fervidibacter sp.]|jgi:hypothetical protein